MLLRFPGFYLLDAQAIGTLEYFLPAQAIGGDNNDVFDGRGGESGLGEGWRKPIKNEGKQGDVAHQSLVHGAKVPLLDPHDPKLKVRYW